MTIDLTDAEMGQLMFILANAEFRNGVTWTLLNPLIVKISGQARNHASGMRPPPPPLEVHDE
jgi:hypothetical protein